MATSLGQRKSCSGSSSPYKRVTAFRMMEVPLHTPDTSASPTVNMAFMLKSATQGCASHSGAGTPVPSAKHPHFSEAQELQTRFYFCTLTPPFPLTESNLYLHPERAPCAETGEGNEQNHLLRPGPCKTTSCTAIHTQLMALSACLLHSL